jgi:DUF1680 family protein
MQRREFLKHGLTVGATALVGREAAGLQIEPAAKPLDEFGYGDVQLAPGLAQTQFEATQDVLLSLNDDSIMRPWRLRAGLAAPGEPLGGWYDEKPLVKTPSGGEGFAPGECTGQWISALARGYAATRDPLVQAKLRRLLEMYAPAISGKFYTNFRFPAYNYDKWVIGLIDAHQFAGVENAFQLLDRTTDAAEPHLPPRGLDRDVQREWRASVGDKTTDDYTWDESYTMPENLYLAAQRGAGERYRKMAPKFLVDKTYFDPLAEGKNVLPDHHAYSYCNALSSAMQAYMVGGSEKHLRAATNAHEMIVTTQSFATGGWGPDESFRAPGTGALYESLTKTKHSFETPCGSYAHFKLTRYLLRVTRDGKYGDSMERVLYNTVLGAKPLLKDGHAFYYSDYSNNSATKFYFDDKFPCCAGTLPQVAADYRILGYFHDSDGVFVNLYLPSTLKWAAANGAHLSLTQSGGYPLEGRVALVMKASKATDMALRLRIPAWAQADAGAATQVISIHVNGLPVSAPVSKGFATLRRKWKDGDRVELNLPLPMRLEAIDPQHPDTVALVRGPLVLFALTDDAPQVTREQLLAAKRMRGQSLWQAGSSAGPLLLTPFTEIHEERYRTYMTVS